MAPDITLSDYLDTRNVAFDWAESYDTKNWQLLRQCLAPRITLDFRSPRGALHENISPDEYVAILSNKKLLGDTKLKTQHLMGAAKWERLGDDVVQVTYQLRVAHQRYTDEKLAVVANKGHAHECTTHRYRRIEGGWKLEAIAPKLEWSEYDLFGTPNPKEGSD